MPPLIKDILTPCGAPRKLYIGTWNVNVNQPKKCKFLIIKLIVARNLVFTWVIRPNKVADDDRRRWGAIPAAPLAFKVRWSSKRSVDALDNQYAKISLLSCV